MSYKNEIHNIFSYVERQGTADNDSIFNYAEGATLNGGAGDDLISLGGAYEVVRYFNGGGNDTVLGAGQNTTLDVDYDSVEFTSDAVILGVGDNSITLKDLTAGFRFENTVVGTANDDYIRTEGAEGLRVVGFSGNDSILNYALNTTIDGGAGNDSILNGNEGSSGRNALILGGDGDDTLGNAGYYATINGGKGNDVIRTSTGVDAVLEYHDGDGDDTVYGISDKLTFAFDYESYTRSGNDVIVPIGDGSITFKSAYRDSRFFRLLRGTDGDELLTNDKVYFSIDGGAGNDTLVNPGNDVTLNGGAGDDVISLNGGLTYIDYTSGNDTVYGFNEWTGQLAFRYDSLEEAGNDVIVRVGDGSITLKDTTRAQVLFVMRGSDDADYIRNSSRVKYIVSGAGDDTIINEAGSSTIDGGDDNDSIVSNSERSRYVLIRGGAGNDSIGVGGGYSTVEGGGGDDYINNGGYANAVDGGKGNDVIENEGDQSTLRGGADNDSMSNNAQYSTLDGDEGNDALTNSGWYSMLRGGAGNDTLINRDGKATFDGGDGNDVISLVGGRAVVQYSGGNDSIYGYDEYTTLAFNYDSVSRSGSDVIMRIGSGTVTFKNLSSSMIDRLAPIAASDDGVTIYSDVGFRNILGGAGNDSIYHFFGTSVTIDGAGGNDTIINDEGGNASLLGGDGDDYINSNEYAIIDGGAGNDTIINKGDSSINGGAGNELIVDNNTSNYPATIAGGAGNDTVSLKSGRARLEYSAGDGNDVIYGFTDLTTLGFNYDDVQQSGNDVVLTVGNNTITLKDTPICLLTGKIEGKPVHSDNIANKSSNKYITTYSGGDTITNKGSNVYINAGDDRDMISNSGGTVSIFGGRGDDTIISSGLNVTINGGRENDRINISGGSVVLQFDSISGNDTVLGFNDKSTLDFNIDGIRQSGSNVIATVGRGSITFVNTPIERVYPKVNGSNANDLLVNEKNFAQVNGGTGNDTLVNSGSNATLDGGAGDDVISLDGGSARIDYTSGNDTVYGFDSSTTLGFDYDSAVQSGADVILRKGGGSITLKDTSVEPFISIVTIDGGNVITLNGSARVEYSGGDGTVYGYGSNTTLNVDYDAIAQSGADVILGVGDGSITLKDVSIDAFKSTVSGSEGNDHIVNDRPLVYIDGGAGNDTLVNSGVDVTINGGRGDDLISLVGGSARILFQDGDGNDTIIGTDGDDSLANSHNGKYLAGAAGNDTLTNTGSNATLNGGLGDDVISLDGGSARIEYEYGDGNDTVYGFDSDTTLGFAYDAVERSGNDVVVSIGDGNITFKDASIARFINGIEGSDDADSIANADDGKYIDGKAGNDTLTNSGSDATIEGGKGNDVISLDGGSARIFFQAGDGNDTIFGFDGSTTLDFEYDAVAKSGADVIMTVGNNALTLKETSYARFVDGIVGTNANDRLINTDPSKYIDGAGGNDTITNSGSNATIEGGDGYDRIIINGGSGASINGGAGNDVISLGGGSARIFYRDGDGYDTIYGFSDKTTLDFDYDNVQQSGNDVIMSIGDGSITFKNTALSLFNDENSNDQLSAILEPTAPVELGDIDPAVSKIFLSIDKHFGVNRIAHRRRT